MMQIGMGSARELEAQMIVAFDLGFVRRQEAARVVLQVREVQRMLTGLLRHKRNRLDALNAKPASKQTSETN